MRDDAIFFNIIIMTHIMLLPKYSTGVKVYFINKLSDEIKDVCYCNSRITLEENFELSFL